VSPGPFIGRALLALLAAVAIGASAAGVGDAFDELARWQVVLEREPANRDALRGRVFALAKLGAPQLALELADRNPGLLSADEREAMAADRTAHRIRWGTIAADTGRGPERFAALDRALAESDAVGLRALDPTVTLSRVERQLALDRLVALRDRFRMREAIDLHRALAARPDPVPPYALSAAASAHLYLEEPEAARDLYRRVLEAEPKDLDAHLGLFYALAESEDHVAALAQVEHAVSITPKWIGAWSPETTHENPRYPGVLSARAMAPLQANRVGEAEERLQVLANQMPYNTNVRTDHASTMRARGWPRAAETELRWVLAVDPDNSGALGERAGALLEMRDWRGAQAALATAQSAYFDQGRVKRAARLSEVHGMRELVVDADFGRSSGGPFGTQDHVIDARLYSEPLAMDYRLFLHAHTARARFTDGTGRRDRFGVGLEYRSTRFSASGELAHELNESDTSAALAIAFTPDDHWTFRAALDSAANETPLQARRAGVDARRASAEIEWRAHESRTLALSFAHMPFSDGNRRNIVEARWTERVIVGPVYKLEITAGLYASRNSLAGAPYFNPSRDLAPTLEFANEWLHWRRYTRSFKHRLVVTIGRYSQENFASGPVQGLRYEQEWAANDQLSVRYGIGRHVQPYDGVRSPRDYAQVSLNWRF